MRFGMPVPWGPSSVWLEEVNFQHSHNGDEACRSGAAALGGHQHADRGGEVDRQGRAAEGELAAPERADLRVGGQVDGSKLRKTKHAAVQPETTRTVVFSIYSR